VSRKKAVVQPVLFTGRIGRLPFRGTEAWGRKVMQPHSIITLIAGSTPNNAVQENGTYGGQGKAVGFPRLTALLSLELPHTRPHQKF